MKKEAQTYLQIKNFFIFTKKTGKLNITEQVRFKLGKINKLLANLIVIFILLNIALFMILFIQTKSDFILFLILIFIFLLIVYHQLLFRNYFTYAVSKQGLLIKGLHYPKLFPWNIIKSYKLKKGFLIINLKHSRLILPYKKGIEKQLKKTHKIKEI